MKPGRFLFLSISFLFISVLLPAQNKGITINNTELPALKFEQNKNQFDSRVLYQSDLASGARLYLEKNCFTYLFWNTEQVEELHHPHAPIDPSVPRKSGAAIDMHAFKATFLNANPDPYVSAQYPVSYYRNYFLGNDQSKWASGVQLFTEVNYTGLYPAIDLRVYNNNAHLEYDYVVNDGGDANAIRVQYSGADRIYLQDGNLVIQTSLGAITEQKPKAYQVINGRETEVRCAFHIDKNNIVSFVFPNGYDHSVQLIIDPTLIVSTFSGSTGDNWGFTATYDNAGNIYAGGVNLATGYPVTVGAYQTVYAGGGSGGNPFPYDIAITKYDPTGASLLYATYIGGSDNEQPNSIVVDVNNNLCIIGRTYSTNFPTTAGAYDVSHNGGADIYVAKLDPSGSTLVASTFIGGTGDDGVNINADIYTCTSLKYNYGDDGRSDINTDNAGNCYIASNTQSNNFPTTGGAFQTAFGGGFQDGCVFKMNANLTALVFSTFLGGNADDAAYSIGLNAANEVYVSGGTNSANFPTTPGAFHTTYQGGTADGFAVHFDPTGSAALQSSFIGTGGYDQAYFIQLDGTNNVYLFGQTSGAYPVTPGVYNVPNSGQFIHKLDPTISTTVYSMMFGSGSPSPNISPSAFLVDTCENVYTSGWGGQCLPIGNQGTTQGLPFTGNAFQTSTDGCDFYFFVLQKNANSLLYASFFGGPGGTAEHVDGGTSRFDKRGIIYQSVCAGCGGSSAFPTTPNAWSQTNQSTNCNNAVIKLDFEVVHIFANASVAPSDTICVGSSISFVNNSTGGTAFLWDFGDGSPQDTNAVPPPHFYNTIGSYTVTLIASDSIACSPADTTSLVITVLGPPIVNLGNDTSVCGAINLQLDAGNVGSTYTWSTGATSQTITANSPASYWVIVDNGYCTGVDTIVIQSFAAPALGSDTTLCAGTPLTLDAGNPGSDFLWNTGDTTQTIPVTTTGTYYVTSSSGLCSQTDTIDVTFIPAPVVDLGNDTVLCPLGSFTLDAGNPGFTYSWSTGEQTQTIIASGTATFSVTVTNAGCSAVDSIYVRTLSGVDLGPDQNLCDFLAIQIAAADIDGASYLWSTGDTTYTIDVTEPGTYSVLISFGQCLIADTMVVEGGFGSPALYVPNSFTPNKDALNDVFYAEGTDITSFRMRIFDRWGELLFESSDLYDGWDGIYKGNKVKNDVYVVVTDYTTTCTGESVVHRITHVTVAR